MKRERLGRALREVDLPAPAEAEQRGLELVRAAYEQRPPRREGLRPRRLALALALVSVLAAVLLSPAGAAMRDWVDEVVTTSTPRPEPGLAEIPGGGRLLVQSASGPWVVQPDGARRLLGSYEEATWSPRGLFVAAVASRTLSALEPDGTPRWSITAGARVRLPRWSPSGYRIAYRAGDALRVIAGDGTGDRPIDPRTAPVAPAWSPLAAPELAYLDAGGTLRIADVERAGDPTAASPDLVSAPAGTGVTGLEWGGGGSLILETSPRTLHLRAVRSAKLAGRPEIGARRRLPLPAGTTVVDAALAPGRRVVAAVLTHWRDSGTRSSVVVFGPGGAQPRRLLSVPGSLGEVAWSPDGRRLLVAWPYADQWLFLPLGRGQGRAVADVSTAFSPGQRAASFPRVEGWCCRR